MLYLQAQMVYLIRPSNIAGNLDELLVLWTFMYLKYSDFCFTHEDAYTSCLAHVLRPAWEQCCHLETSHFFATHKMPEGTFLTKKWQLRLSYKLWQCYCFLKFVPLSVWQKNLPSFEASYSNHWATSLFSRGSSLFVVEISLTCRG